MGKTAIEPVLAIVERPLRDDVAMCTGIGEPTKEYPNGEWLDCDPQLQMGATWAYASVNMAAVGGAMGLGECLELPVVASRRLTADTCRRLGRHDQAEAGWGARVLHDGR